MQHVQVKCFLKRNTDLLLLFSCHSVRQWQYLTALGVAFPKGLNASMGGIDHADTGHIDFSCTSVQGYWFMQTTSIIYFFFLS